MTTYKVRYIGKPCNLGRFGDIATGTVLRLSRAEYRSVAEDEDFHFEGEEVEERQVVGRAATPNGPTESSPGNPSPPKEPGFSQGDSPAFPEPAPEVDLSDEDLEELPTDYDTLTADELKAEIAFRNQGRDKDTQIKPASRAKLDLRAALAADDAK